MEDMLTKLLSNIVKQAESLFNDFLISTMDTAFFSEKSMESYVGGNAINFNSVYNVIFAFGISIIILKFLKKGAETYLLWQSGEATNSVGGLLLRFVEALIIAIGFPFIYKTGINIAKDFGESVLKALQVDTSAEALITNLITIITTNGLFTAVLVIILLILIGILYIQLLKRGIEILVLRLRSSYCLFRTFRFKQWCLFSLYKKVLSKCYNCFGTNILNKISFTFGFRWKYLFCNGLLLTCIIS